MFEYESVLANAPVGICFLSNRVFIRCNRRFEEIFGYQEGELDGKSVRLLYPSAEMFQYIGDTYGHFFEKNIYYRDERPMMCRDGTMIWCVVTGKAIDPENPKLGQIWVVQDISEHKRVEDDLKENIEKLELMVQQRTIELRRHVNSLNTEIATRRRAEEVANESQQALQTVFDMMSVGLSVTDSDGNIVQANRIFRQTINIADGQEINWRDMAARFFLADGTPIPSANLPWFINETAAGQIEGVEIGMRRKRGGRAIWLNVGSRPMMLKGQQTVLSVFTDITYRKRIEELERLRHAELTRLGRINSMAEMSAALAHQMGQPLVAALNYLQGCRLRLDRMDGVEEISKSLGIAMGCLDQAGEILRRVRDFVCHHNPEKIPEDVNELIRDSLGFLEFESRKHKVSVELRLDPDVPLVPLCKIEIQQVLFNLMKNGMEAMIDSPEAERILVIGSRVDADEGDVSVYVVDNGSGIRRGAPRRLFEPMFTTKPDGIGIGLTICRCIIESHGGKLSFARAGKQGSRFQFSLPMGTRG